MTSRGRKKQARNGGPWRRCRCRDASRRMCMCIFFFQDMCDSGLMLSGKAGFA